VRKAATSLYPVPHNSNYLLKWSCPRKRLCQSSSHLNPFKTMIRHIILPVSSGAFSAYAARKKPKPGKEANSTMKTDSRLVSRGEVQSTDIESLRTIVTTCLWHEPHSLREIIADVEEMQHPWADSRKELIQYICSALRSAMASGVIKHQAGYLLLTRSGRETVGKAFGL
jgi:hypothetical protein